MKRLDYITASIRAGDVHDSFNIAYWTGSESGNSKFHVDNAVASFKELADIMGYTVTPKEPTP